MNLFSHTLLFGTVFLLTLKELTDACSCIRLHPQEQFCRADVVFHGRVLSKTIIKGETTFDEQVRYGFKLIKIYKGSDKITIISSVYTASQSAACGVELNLVEYLLTGFIQGNKVIISLCGLVIPWKSISSFQIKAISGLYEKGCKCKITYCYGNPCDTHVPNACEWWNEEDARNNACIKTKYGYCAWYPPLNQPNYESHP